MVVVYNSYVKLFVTEMLRLVTVDGTVRKMRDIIADSDGINIFDWG